MQLMSPCLAYGVDPTVIKRNELCDVENDYCDNDLICYICKKDGFAACISGNHYILVFVDLLLVQEERIKFVYNNIETQLILA